MKADAASRLKYINLMLDALDKEVSDCWNKLCCDIENENSKFTLSSIKVFIFKSEFYPLNIADRFKNPVLRKYAVPLHSSLVEEFLETEKVMVREYASFRRKFKFMLSQICTVATSPADFDAVIPETVFKFKEDAAYVPVASATGWEDDQLQEFIIKYKPVLDKAKYYLGVRQLI